MGTKYTNYLASIIKAKLLTHLELMKRKILKMCQLNLFLQIFACLKSDSLSNSSKWLTRTSKLQRWSPIPTNCEESSESIVRDEFTLTKAPTTTTSRFLGWVVVAAAAEATSHLLLLEFSSPWLCSICQLHRSLSGMASQVISSKMWRKNFPIKQGSFFLFFRSQLLSLSLSSLSGPVVCTTSRGSILWDPNLSLSCHRQSFSWPLCYRGWGLIRFVVT